MLKWTVAHQAVLRLLHRSSTPWMDCGREGQVQCLQHLQCLKILTIEFCPKLEGELIKLNLEDRPMRFCSLESICLENLPQLTMICSDNVSFPRLAHLSRGFCPKLCKFPIGFMKKEMPLQGHIGSQIWGTEEWWEGLQWEDEEFKSYLLPLFNKINE